MGGLHVPIDRIVPLTETRDNFSRIVADIENSSDGLYILTKGGKPAIALISVKYLESLMKNQTIETGPELKKAETPSFPPPAVSAPKPTPQVAPAASEAPKIEAAEIRKPPSLPVNQPAAPPKIDPSWRGEKPSLNNPASPTPAANPWPLTPPSSAPAKLEPKSDNRIPGVNDFSTKPAVAPVTPPPPTVPKPAVNPPPPPPLPKPVLSSPPVTPPAPTLPSNPTSNVKPADLPPPPNNPTTIPFESPPKIDIEPGEPLPPPTPTAANNPAPPSSNPVTPTVENKSVQDLDI